jgi:hypothetical protein
MFFDKSPKLLPVRDFLFRTRCWSWLHFNVACFSFPLKPKVDCVATDVESLTGFTFFQSI